MIKNEEIILTPDGALILEKIMRSCSPTVSNGGKSMKKYLLALLIETANRKVYFSEIVKRFAKIKSVSVEYDVYAELAKALEGKEANLWGIIDFFSGNGHINQAIKERDSDDLPKISEVEKDAYFFAHVLTPIVITDVQKNLFDGMYVNNGVELRIKNMRAFPEDEKRFKKGCIVLAHYSCIIDEIDEKMAIKLLHLQMGNERFLIACNNARKNGIDHSIMAYDPWCERITKLI